MTSQEPPSPDHEDLPADEAPQGQSAARPQRPRRQRPEPNPALDPRLLQLERRSRRPSRAGDVSLLLIGVAAFVFGVAMHFWVATSVLNGGDSAESSSAPTATATVPAAQPSPTAATSAPPTATAMPDRTSCDEIRGTQYRSVTEREFFLANCTGQQAQPQPTAADPQPTATPGQ